MVPYFEKDKDFHAYLDKTFSLSNKNTWTGFRLKSAVTTKVIRTRTADAGIVNGRVEVTTETRKKVWQDWQTHCQTYNVPPYLDSCSFEEVARVALNFEGMLRQGCGRKRKPVYTDSISTGIGGVATQIGLDRGTRPLHQPGSKKYILPIQHMLASFNSFDPLIEKKLACHPDLPLFAVKIAYKGKTSVGRQATGYLVCIAFYYLLRVGKCTTKTKQKRRHEHVNSE